MMSCTGKPGCKGKIILDGKCCRHVIQQCSVCFENVKSTNTVGTKRLTCGHSYHSDCILEWFVTSDECPVCREKQLDDPIIIFKLKVEDELRKKYKDAIQSLEDQVSRYEEDIPDLVPYNQDNIFQMMMMIPSPPREYIVVD